MGAVFGSLRVEVTTYRAEAYAAGLAQTGGRLSTAARGRSRASRLHHQRHRRRAAQRSDRGSARRPRGPGAPPAARGGRPDATGSSTIRCGCCARCASPVGSSSRSIRPPPARIRGTAAALGTISRERVRDELDKIVIGPAPALGIGLLCDLGLAEFALPELLALRGMRQETGRHKDVFTHTLQVRRPEPAPAGASLGGAAPRHRQAAHAVPDGEWRGALLRSRRARSAHGASYPHRPASTERADRARQSAGRPAPARERLRRLLDRRRGPPLRARGRRGPAGRRAGALASGRDHRPRRRGAWPSPAASTSSSSASWS